MADENPEIGSENNKSHVVITIGGLPGSGTTTAARLLSDRLGLPWTNGGAIFREMALERKLELNDFGKLAEQDPEIDRELDRRLIRVMRNGGIILESRLAGANAKQHGIDSLRVWLHASQEIRATRIQEREGGELSHLMAEMKERERSERARYLSYYSMDYEDLDHYSLVINSGEMLPEPIVATIIETLKSMEMK